MSSIFPKTESNNSSSIISMTSSTPAASSYNMHSRSAATPTLFPLPDSEASRPGATQSGPDGLATSASPLQRIQSIINTLQPQSSLPNSPQCLRKTFLMQPITQEHFDKYDNINTKELVKKVKDQLNRHAISQRMFGEMLEMPHSSLKRILAQPKPWPMLDRIDRVPFIRMKMFLGVAQKFDPFKEVNIHKTMLEGEKLTRTGSFAGTTTQSLMTFGSNMMSPRNMESNMRTTGSLQFAPNNAIYSSHSQPSTSDPETYFAIPSNMMSPRLMENNMETAESRQFVPNNALYSSHIQSRTPETHFHISSSMMSSRSMENNMGIPESRQLVTNTAIYSPHAQETSLPFSSNMMTPWPVENNPRTPESRQFVPSNAIHSLHSQPNIPETNLLISSQIMSPGPMENNLETAESLQFVLNSSNYSTDSQPRTPETNLTFLSNRMSPKLMEDNLRTLESHQFVLNNENY